ncbi:MAG: hypothetical protein JF603_00580 [Acidobacteria bacterium]|nr:hypothetical protein [Verrucomicrobiota bacterium]MBW8824834.1 hypothetical protein [Acidobacteriota bacterium]
MKYLIGAVAGWWLFFIPWAIYDAVADTSGANVYAGALWGCLATAVVFFLADRADAGNPVRPPNWVRRWW